MRIKQREKNQPGFIRAKSGTFLAILLIIISYLPAHAQNVSDDDVRYIVERIKPPLSVTFSVGLSSSRSFRQGNVETGQADAVSENKRLFELWSRDKDNPHICITLARSYISSGRVKEGNQYFLLAEKLMLEKIDHGIEFDKNLNNLADLYLEILIDNLYDSSIRQSYTTKAMELNERILKSTDKISVKDSAARRTGMILFLNGDYRRAQTYLNSAGKNSVNDFDLFFASEIIRMFSFISRNMQNPDFRAVFASKPLAEIYDFTPINTMMRNHPDDRRYTSFLNFTYLWLIFMKSALINGEVFFDATKNEIHLSTEDSVLLAKVEKYFIDQKTHNTITGRDLNLFLGLISFIKKDIKSSLGYYNAAFDENSADLQCMSILIYIYSQLGDYSGAISVIQKKIKKNEEARDNIWLAAIYDKMNHTAMAERSIKRAIEIDKNDISARFIMSTVYLKLKQYKEAYDEADYAVKNVRKEWTYYHELQIVHAAALLATGRKNDAYGILKDILNANASGNIKDRTVEILKKIFFAELAAEGIRL